VTVLEESGCDEYKVKIVGVAMSDQPGSSDGFSAQMDWLEGGHPRRRPALSAWQAASMPRT